MNDPLKSEPPTTDTAAVQALEQIREGAAGNAGSCMNCDAIASIASASLTATTTPDPETAAVRLVEAIKAMGATIEFHDHAKMIVRHREGYSVYNQHGRVGDFYATLDEALTALLGGEGEG